ncbi:MAG: alpha/beta fold hydrolase [Pseudomonadales bacterium]|mgnify:FL=1|jgi:dienelactone hydrolase|nr:alpha/beta fold hydrolase [Pseudomonadales bacterium]MDP7358965.1 alpha/beta fold hydrolase [Pseudomonadales bacterium]MDP7595788.1 alpha/beta fold hydrolase [Pseudomonadales bacterium]HJN48905.1 alpha/beta fold hydrolase [Pseudomonadales bacterium]|tara:strand:- start:2677 stop:3390 length:714 start_codon:yes stop_codon:yes gene_type:complete
MSWNNKNVSHDGVEERGFELQVNKQTIPGVYWTPSDKKADRLVLLGHGGSTHKKVDYIENLAFAFSNRGIAAMAIDGPGHGERAKGGATDDPDSFAKVWRAGGGNDGMLADWKAALDFIEAEEGARPTGWWGLSMGTMMGLPVTATDSRIRIALLGLMGTWGPNKDDLTRLASEVTCPVRFLVQWDDEIVPRDACLELYDALGTRKKTLHGNPGKHQQVPEFEVDGSVDYLDRYLRS